MSSDEPGAGVCPPTIRTDSRAVPANPKPHGDSGPVIDVRDVSKCFMIYDRPSDRLRQFVVPRLQRLRNRPQRQFFREFWALRDVSFDVARGDTVGIVGRNGSGKSTLLQIVCGTLTPTSGTVETRGRIAALLELGSGFNPEFSGRDNVYMNAALLGLSREQVDERFDRIAAFADIGEHLEQPVKTYSSGMFVRLAFAVIAHVDADVLVIDEALAVGDAVFTQRCMRFIRRFQQDGTLLFVSHDTSAVRNLCRQAVWLDRGRMVMRGPSAQVSNAYLRASLQELYGDDVSLEERRTARHDLESGGAVDDIRRASDELFGADAGETETETETETASEFGIEIETASEHSATDASPVILGARTHVTERVDVAAGFSTGKARIESVQMRLVASNPAREDSKEPGGEAVVLQGGERVRLRVRAVAEHEIDQPILGFLVKDRLGQDLFGENTLGLTEAQPRRFRAGEPFEAEFVFRLPMLPNGEYSVMASVAEGTLYDNIQHQYLHDALILTVSSSRVRWGLVGIPFERVSMQSCEDGASRAA